MKYDPDVNTNENLRRFGYRTRPTGPAGFGRAKEVLQATGPDTQRVVFTGKVQEVNQWLMLHEVTDFELLPVNATELQDFALILLD